MNIIAKEHDARADSGVVNNIQHYCTEDGPGIRTAVFLKGCSLACKWCCNPESLHTKPELAFMPHSCIGVEACGLCIDKCAESAIGVVPGEDMIHVDFDACTHCGDCAVICPARALKVFGQVMTVDEVIAEVEKDGNFFMESGGGISLSGGECMVQPEFSAALLQAAHARGFNTVVETASNVPYASFQAVLPHTDMMLHDIKLIDSDAHQTWTGVGNERILEGLQRAYVDFPETVFVARTPVIPGVNDTAEHVRAVLEFIRPFDNVIAYHLLPYHRFGESRYEYMGRDYELAGFTSPSGEDMQRLRSIVDEEFNREGASLATSYPPGLTL